MINKKIMQQHFSRNAVRYDTYATVQKQMAQELDILLAEDEEGLEPKGLILDVGCGTGGMLAYLTRHFPVARIVAMDIASGMIAVARRKVLSPQISFVCGDIETLELEQKFDLIVSNATFQWFNAPGATLQKLYRCLNPGGRIAFATFGPATFQELHQSFRLAQSRLGIWTATLPGQRFLSCTEWEALCRKHIGSEAAESYSFTSREHLVVQFFDTARDFVRAVKKAGANNSNRERSIHPALTREQLKIYEERFGVGGQVGATYHCIYVGIRKGGH